MVRRPWTLVGWISTALFAVLVGGPIALDSICANEIDEVSRALREIPGPDLPRPRPLRGDPLPGSASEDYREIMSLLKTLPPQAPYHRIEDARRLSPLLAPLLLSARRTRAGSLLPSDLGTLAGVAHRIGAAVEEGVRSALQAGDASRALDLSLAEVALQMDLAASRPSAFPWNAYWTPGRLEQILGSGSAEVAVLLGMAQALERLEAGIPAPGELNRIRAQHFGTSVAGVADSHGGWGEDPLPIHLGIRYAWSKPLRTLSSLRHYQRALQEARAIESLPLPVQVPAGIALQHLDQHSWFGWARSNLHPGHAARETTHQLRRLRGLRQAALYLAGREDRLEDPLQGRFDVADEHGVLTVRCGCHEAVVVQLHRS